MTKTIKISPSIMVSRVEEFAKYIALFDELKVSSIHFDVMDGHFVENIMLGTNSYRDIKRLSNLPVDLHLMAFKPEKFLNYFNPQENDTVCFHPEATNQPYRLLQEIRARGCKAGFAFSPGTPLSYLEESLDQIDFVVLMTVNPGFAGQKLAPNAFAKIERVRALIGCEMDLFVDGNTSFENSKKMREHGANGFVTGSSSLMRSLEEFPQLYNKYLAELSAI